MYFQQCRANFLHVAEHAGTAGASVEPDGKWGWLGIGVGLDEEVMEFAVVLLSVEIARIHGRVSHAQRSGKEVLFSDSLAD